MKRRFTRIRPMVITFTVVYVFVMLLGSTFSWFTGKDGTVNNFKSPDIEFSVKLIDVFSKPVDFTPGDTAEKIVGATNLRTIPAFVRLMVLPSVISADGQPLEAEIGKEIELIGNTSGKWIYGNDGYYYYLEVLGPAGSGSDTSESLFTGVKLTNSLGAEYNNAKLKIVVKTEAIDTKKWNYRTSWWQADTHPSVNPLAGIDTILSDLAI